jgi:hypothetical protein
MSAPVVITLGSEFTAWITGPRIAWLLDQCGLPRQYDAASKCWMTSRRSVPELEAYLQSRKRPVIIREVLQ